MNYKKLNIITGWLVFLVATWTYVATIEPTASFWDCGEFIATANRLEVGHTPGAPLFMMIGRVASAFVSPENVPVAINTLSALCSSLTILFLFWSITHMAHKLVTRNGAELELGGIIAILGSGVVGALAYTWSDTFWFSAVEAEVYSMSSLVTAVTFWAILKWENVAGRSFQTRRNSFQLEPANGSKPESFTVSTSCTAATCFMSPRLACEVTKTNLASGKFFRRVCKSGVAWMMLPMPRYLQTKIVLGGRVSA